MTISKHGAWVMCCYSLFVFTGCDALVLSQRQQVVQDAHDAICMTRDISSMKPFVAKKSQSLLDLSASLTGLAKIFGGVNISDRIAIECHTAKLKFIDEIKVSEDRYIIRTQSGDSQQMEEMVVVFEDGAWKISFY